MAGRSDNRKYQEGYRICTSCHATSNLTSAPEATTQANVSGIIDKNDKDVLSDNGLIKTLTFFDNLGYSYTARFAMKSTGTDGKYTVELEKILNSDGTTFYDPETSQLN